MATQPARKHSEWLAPSKLDFFKDYRGEIAYRTYTLGSPQLVRILSRYYEIYARNLTFIHVEGRILLGEEGEPKVEKAEEITRNTLENCKALINKKIEQAEHILKEAGSNLPTSHNKPVALEVPIVSPYCRLFLEILQRADYYIQLNAALWFEGEIDDRNKNNNVREIRKITLNIVHGVRAQFNFVRRMINKHQATVAIQQNMSKAA